MHTKAKTSGRLNIELVGESEIRFTRAFAAAPQHVWDAHTKPELVKRWMLGPPGWSMPVCEIDLRVGGKYRYDWRNDESGEGFGLGGEYREVSEPVRLVATELFDGGMMGPETVNEQAFAATPGGGTQMTMICRYTSSAHRESALATGMADGMEQSYDRMEAVLATP